MSALQITLGAADATNWAEIAVTALVPATVGAGAALLGVWLSNRTAVKQRETDAKEKARISKGQRELAALALADHLENFTLLCCRVVDSFWGAVWESPYSSADYGVQPLYLEDLPPWPVLVDWGHLGAARAVKSENLRRRIQLKREWLRGDSDHVDAEDYHASVADLAAALGLDAWRHAQDIREENSLDPFDWPDDLDGADRLADHVRRRHKIKSQQDAQTGPLLD